MSSTFPGGLWYGYSTDGPVCDWKYFAGITNVVLYNPSWWCLNRSHSAYVIPWSVQAKTTSTANSSRTTSAVGPLPRGTPTSPCAEIVKKQRHEEKFNNSFNYRKRIIFLNLKAKTNIFWRFDILSSNKNPAKIISYKNEWHTRSNKFCSFYIYVQI